ncbi:MAG: HAMP domain-containing histidine kinase [Candidatus Thiodiazotropha sp. (ex Monitilora ramsayi)]|nr:HAMP domain-containing histidine kinase [Candidatus Thiodiazotropha sp. (ex Monitilora ramsayi)]
MQDSQQQKEVLGLTSAFAMVSHDIKNSLGILLKYIGTIAENCDLEASGVSRECADMEYEVRRINNNLVKMLTLFKVEEGNYLLNVDAHAISEFLEEEMLEHGDLTKQKGIGYEIECSEDLYWYFDRNLMTGVMSNAISNALRYTKDWLRVTAEASEEGLVISVEDNGGGFPQSMLDNQGEFFHPESGFLNNNTGLGLYFTQVVLDLHKHDGKQGSVSLSNGGILGGGCCRILLP